MLGQVRVAEGSNEITAIPALLDVDTWGLLDTEGWSSLRTVALVECERTLLPSGKTTRERRYSLAAEARDVLSSVRSDWKIEHQVHCGSPTILLDVAFDEDRSRVRRGHAASNLSVVRRVALNLSRQEDGLRLGVANKRLRAGWNEAYLLKVLQRL